LSIIDDYTESIQIRFKLVRLNLKGIKHTIWTIKWGKFSQKHNYTYTSKWWCLLAIENYMFRPMVAIIRFWQLSCYKIFI